MNEMDQLCTDDHEVSAMNMLRQSFKTSYKASAAIDLTKKGFKMVSFGDQEGLPPVQEVKKEHKAKAKRTGSESSFTVESSDGDPVDKYLNSNELDKFADGEELADE